MAFFADARLVQSIRRRSGRILAAAMLALGLGALAAGEASAQSPTVDTRLAFQGWVNIVELFVAGNTTRLVYTVPANRKFLLTDLVISNSSSATNPARYQLVYTGTNATCGLGLHRTSHLSVPGGGTVHIPFVTGIDFNAGQHVCIFNGDPTSTATYWTIRGFLFQ
jgi:hypothetical protein